MFKTQVIKDAIEQKKLSLKFWDDARNLAETKHIVDCEDIAIINKAKDDIHAQICKYERMIQNQE